MFEGSMVALITPFNDEQIDEQAICDLVEWHIAEGTNAIVPVGTTGESPVLSRDEHLRVVGLVVEQAAGRVPVIAGAGSNNPIEAIDYTLAAQRLGAQAALHVAGYYNRPSQEGLYQHFKAVHDATELPLIIYNIPPRAIVDITPATMARLAALPRVVGVKDATGDLARPWLERQLIGDAFSYLSGEDATAVAYNVSGGRGCISVTANVAPALCAQMHKACLADDYVTARRIQDRLMPLHEALFCEPSPAGVKYALSLLGRCKAYCRLPAVPVSVNSQQRITAAMSELGLIS